MFTEYVSKCICLCIYIIYSVLHSPPFNPTSRQTSGCTMYIPYCRSTRYNIYSCSQIIYFDKDIKNMFDGLNI